MPKVIKNPSSPALDAQCAGLDAFAAKFKSVALVLKRQEWLPISPKNKKMDAVYECPYFHEVKSGPSLDQIIAFLNKETNMVARKGRKNNVIVKGFYEDLAGTLGVENPSKRKEKTVPKVKEVDKHEREIIAQAAWYKNKSQPDISAYVCTMNERSELHKALKRAGLSPKSFKAQIIPEDSPKTLHAVTIPEDQEQILQGFLDGKKIIAEYNEVNRLDRFGPQPASSPFNRVTLRDADSVLGSVLPPEKQTAIKPPLAQKGIKR